MKCRQTSVPSQWLIVDHGNAEDAVSAIRRLPPGSGVLILCRDMAPTKRARLLAGVRHMAGKRSLTVADELAREARRVHSAREIRKAGLAGVPLLFLSPIYPTASHPGWAALPRMRSAALRRLAKASMIALGGMDARRFETVRRLGFQGWAGISAWRLSSPSHAVVAAKPRRQPLRIRT